MRVMRKPLAVFAAVLALATLAGAPSASGQANKEAKVRKLIELTGGEDLAKQMLDSMMSEISKSPDLPPGFAEKFRELAMKEDIVSMYVPIYVKHVQDADLDAAIAFYSTPSGKRFVKAQPAILQESMAVGQQWGERLGKKAMEEISTRKPPQR